ncbi:MAG: hypothetical protein ACLSAF_13335 [Intestinimonas sp.]
MADYVVGSTEMHILTQPAVAAQPDAPFDPVRSICKGALLGLALGLAVVASSPRPRRTVRTPEEVKRRLNRTCHLPPCPPCGSNGAPGNLTAPSPSKTLGYPALSWRMYAACASSSSGRPRGAR